MFTDKEKFVDAPSTDYFDFTEEPIGQNKKEIFTYNGSIRQPSFGHFYAHIP